MRTANFVDRTKHLKSGFAILILVFALNFDAFPQYTKLTRGQVNPYDTAVAVRIDRFREEGLKLRLGQQLVDSLVAEIYSLQFEVQLSDSLQAINWQTIRSLYTANERKDSVTLVLAGNVNKLSVIAERQTKWYNDPKTYVIALVAYEILKLFLQ